MKLRRITGRTMSPQLTPGAIVAIRHRQPRLGDVVLANENGHEVLKRIVHITNAEMILENDQPPKHRISLQRNDILGTVLFVLPGPQPAPKPHKPHALLWGAVAASVLIAMVTAQLISFDKFIVLLNDYQLPIMGQLVGSVLVAVTVAALPYLLHMAISPAARLVSALAGWLTALLWTLLGIQSMIVNTVTSTGHLGTVVDIFPGVWTILYGIVLLVLVVNAQRRLGGIFRYR